MIEITKTTKFGKVEVWNEIKDLYTSEKQSTIKKIQALLKIDMQKIEEKINYDNVIDGEIRIYGRLGSSLRVTLKVEISENCLCNIPLNIFLKIINQSLEVVNTFILPYNKVTKKDVVLQNTDKGYIQTINFSFSI